MKNACMCNGETEVGPDRVPVKVVKPEGDAACPMTQEMPGIRRVKRGTLRFDCVKKL